MPTTNAYKLAGNTVGLSVTASSHTAVLISAEDISANALLFHNTSTSVAVYVTALSSPTNASVGTAAASTIPGDGTAGSLPISGYEDMVLAGMSFPVSLTAIGSAAGPTLITATPITLL